MFQRWIDLSQQKSCLILGPRRCGKTTLLRHRYTDLKFVTLDDLEALDWAKRDPKGFVAHLAGSAIIDEIQRLPILTVVVKYAADNEKAKFLMTGSSNIGLLDTVADTLAGRIDILALPTLCWGESNGRATHSIFEDRASYPDIRKAYRLLDEAIIFGQFPEVVQQTFVFICRCSPGFVFSFAEIRW